jgi:hypothetical protein
MTDTGRWSRRLVLVAIWVSCSASTGFATFWYLFSWHRDSLRDAQAAIGMGFVGAVGWIAGVLPVLIARHTLIRRPATGKLMVMLSAGSVWGWGIAAWMAGMHEWGWLEVMRWLLIFPPLSVLFVWMAPFAPSNFRYALAVVPLLVALGIIDIWVTMQRHSR